MFSGSFSFFFLHGILLSPLKLGGTISSGEGNVIGSDEYSIQTETQKRPCVYL